MTKQQLEELNSGVLCEETELYIEVGSEEIWHVAYFNSNSNCIDYNDYVHEYFEIVDDDDYTETINLEDFTNDFIDSGYTDFNISCGYGIVTVRDSEIITKFIDK